MTSLEIEAALVTVLLPAVSTGAWFGGGGDRRALAHRCAGDKLR